MAIVYYVEWIASVIMSYELTSSDVAIYSAGKVFPQNALPRYYVDWVESVIMSYELASYDVAIYIAGK